MLSFADLKAHAKSGFRVNLLGYDFSIKVARSHAARGTALAKIMSNDLRLGGAGLDQLLEMEADPSSLPLRDLVALSDLRRSCLALADPFARDVMIREALFQAWRTASDVALRARLAAKIAESYLRSGVPEEAARVLALIPADLMREELAATVQSQIDAAASGFQDHTPDPVDRVLDGRYQFLQHVFTAPDLVRGRKVLHVAPEDAIQRLMRQNAAAWSIDYTTLDGFSSAASIKDDVRQLAIPDLHYDLIICHHVLEHVLDDTLAIQEFFRVLRPGGVLHVSVPQSGHLPQTIEWSIPDRNADGHVRAYGSDFSERLAAAGFRCAKHVYLERCYLDERRIWRRPYYICQRPLI